MSSLMNLDQKNSKIVPNRMSGDASQSPVKANKQNLNKIRQQVREGPDIQVERLIDENNHHISSRENESRYDAINICPIEV